MNGSEPLKIVLLTRVSFALQSDSKIPMSRELPFIRRGIIILEIYSYLFSSPRFISLGLFSKSPREISMMILLRVVHLFPRDFEKNFSKKIPRVAWASRDRHKLGYIRNKGGRKGGAPGRIACRTRISRDTRGYAYPRQEWWQSKARIWRIDEFLREEEEEEAGWGRFFKFRRSFR